MDRAVLITSLFNKRRLLLLALVSLLFSVADRTASANSDWNVKLDGRVRFYQTTELGALIVGTDRSLYALDGQSGEVLWRRKGLHLDETDVAPIIGTDLLLLNIEKDKRTRLEAVDLISGKPLWQSDKLKGSVMQLAVDLQTEAVAIVLVRAAKDQPREGFKRRPTVHLLRLGDGDELWKRELDGEVEMMPAQWFSDDGNDERETVYTLDNYRAPLFLDGRLYLFYEGVTSLDARTGQDRLREKFRVNEEGLALTEADPIVDEQHIYVSGRGRVRAIARQTGREVWEAKDLGLTPEMILAGDLLYVRTGGQFTRLKDGEIVERGPYGVSAIDPTSGKILWRYKGADKGITNLALLDERTALVADRDELITLNATDGKPRGHVKHRIDRAAFVLLNETRQAVVGGRNEIAAFDPNRGGRGDDERNNQAVWRARYDAPGRGVLRTIAAIAAKSASLYFRFGGVATTAFRGVQIARAASSLRWSGLAARAALPNLTDYAAGAAREYVSGQFRSFGVLARADSARRGLRTLSAPRINVDVDIEERLLDRLDPARQLDRLSSFIWRRERLAVVRGQHMYFYTDLRGLGRGLAGVNFNTGAAERMIRLNEPDYRLTTDEVTGLLYTAQGERLFAYRLGAR